MYRQNFNNDTIFNSESHGNDAEYNSPSSIKKNIVNSSPRYGYDNNGNSASFQINIYNNNTPNTKSQN